MTTRLNRAIELLSQDQPIYYTGGHTGHILTYEQGKADAHTWADYINIGMEHGAFNMAGLDAYMRGLVDGGPTNSGHRTPTVIVEAPVEGVNEAIVRYNAWQFRQILARGVHGILLCQAESAAAVRAFVESCRYPINRDGVGIELGEGRRGVGSEPSATAIWGVSRDEYLLKADPWPLNPDGELLLGLKIESAAAIPHIEEILSVPGIGFAEMGPGDLSLSLGYLHRPDPLPPEMAAVRQRVRTACHKNGIAFLETATEADIAQKIDEGARVISGGREELAKVGRAHTGRTMAV
jgi:4-hydroxy-2-oxoheptanedioate aldolase